MFELVGTLNGGGFVQNAHDTQADAMTFGRSYCESFEILDNDERQVYMEFPPTRWV